MQLAHNIYTIAHTYLDFYLKKLKYLKPQRIPNIDVENHKRILSILYFKHLLLKQSF